MEEADSVYIKWALLVQRLTSAFGYIYLNIVKMFKLTKED